MKTKLLLVFTMLCSALQLWAQPGQLDLTYNPAPNVGAFGGTPPPATQNSSAECIVYRSRIYTSGPNIDKIIIVGRFTSFNGTARKYIARLTPNGTIDPTFTGPAFSNGFLYTAQILPDGKILVAGDFTVGGYSSLARLNEDGSLDTTFNPTGTTLKGANNWVLSVEQMPDGRILAGGTFTQYNGVTNKRMIRLLEDGTPDPTFSAAGTVNGEVRAICLQDDKILVGGFFSGFSGYANKNKIVRLNADGSYDTTFNTSGNGATGGTAVFDIKLLDGKIFIGGKFNSFNGVDKRSIARLLPNGDLDPDFNVGNIGVTNPESNAGIGHGYNIFSICVQPDGKLLLGGNFTQYNGENIPKGLARIYQDGSRDLTFVTGTGFTGGTLVYEGKSVVRHMALQTDGRIVVGGDFTQYNGTNRRMSARIKTRDCDSSTQYLSESGWADETLPTTSAQMALIHSGTYTIPTGLHLVCCDLQINSGASLVIASGASLSVHGNITNNGVFIVEDAGSLVQVNDNATYSTLGSGIFISKRNTTPVKRYDYTYWSSPVQSTTLYNVSPNTLSDKFYKFNATGNNWVGIPNGAETMSRGKGYIIRAPQTHSITAPSVFTALFTGRPNNGVITTPIGVSGTNKWNLIGNPYPSAIDIASVLSDPANSGVGGTIYLWTHNTPLTYDLPTGYYLYTSDDYATYNSTGYVTPGGFSPSTFDGKIASGQGFFVEGLTHNSTVTFRNSMRVAENNTQFFRTSSEFAANAVETPQSDQPIEKSRFWLNLTNTQGAFNQMLVGYVTGATNGVDRDFDGTKMSGNYVSLYSMIDSEKFTINGRSLPFDQDDKVKLGYKVTVAGTFSISLAQMDGLFIAEDNDIFLRDRRYKVDHNLKESAYEFTSAVGEFNDRFEIVYRSRTTNLVSDKMIPNIVASVNRNTISVNAEENIQRVDVYDITGKKLFTADNINGLVANLEGIPQTHTVLLLSILLEDGRQETKKVLF